MQTMRPLEFVGTFSQASALLSRLAPSFSSPSFSSSSSSSIGLHESDEQAPDQHNNSKFSASTSVLLALSNNSASSSDWLVALAKRKTLIVSHINSPPKSDSNITTTTSTNLEETIHHFDDACGMIEENVTAIEWVQIVPSNINPTTGTASASSSSNENILRNRHSKEKVVLMIGTSAGWIRFFTDKGRLLHQQQFQKGVVRQIKVRTANLWSDVVEDVTILYATNPSVVVRIDGRSLCKFLRHRCGQANNSSSSSSIDGKLSSFSFHIWSMASSMNDAVICGGYADASNLDIYLSKISGGSKILRIIGVGGDPIISTYQIPADDIAGNSLSSSSSSSEQHSDSKGSLASAVATRLGAAFRNSDAEKSQSPLPQTPLPAPQPPALLPITSEFHDSPREIVSIVPSPGHLFAASSDNLGRVILWDIQGSNPVAIRIIKGVREAQLSWIFHNRTLYCVIYFPRRNLLEVLDLFSGRRVVSRFLGALGTKFLLSSCGTVVNLHTSTLYRIALS